MLRWRLISAAVIITGLAALIWLDLQQGAKGTPGVWLLPLLIGVSLLATEELLSLLRVKGHQPVAWIVYLGNTVIPLAAGLPVLASFLGLKPNYWADTPLAAPLAAFSLVVILVLIGEMARFRQPGTAIVDAALSVFAVAYIGVLLSFWAFLRLQHGNEWGMVALASMLVIVKMADTGAFVFGKLFGRHRMTPILSPGKTWEGSIGGIATACAASFLFFHFFTPLNEPIGAVVLYGALLAVAGMIGDLAESMIKRDAGQKDSSTWLRGLGGVLDIIDAPLVAGPVAWLCWTMGLLGP